MITLQNLKTHLFNILPEFFTSKYSKWLDEDNGWEVAHPTVAYIFLEWFYPQFKQNPDSDLSKRALAFLEEMANSDDEKITDAVQTGFFENLNPSDPDAYKLYVRLGFKSQQMAWIIGLDTSAIDSGNGYFDEKLNKVVITKHPPKQGTFSDFVKKTNQSLDE